MELCVCVCHCMVFEHFQGWQALPGMTSNLLKNPISRGHHQNTKDSANFSGWWCTNLTKQFADSLLGPKNQQGKCEHPFKTTHPVGSFNPPKTSWWLNHPLWKNSSQNWNLPQIGVKINNMWNYDLEKNMLVKLDHFPTNRGEFSTPLRVECWHLFEPRSFKAPRWYWILVEAWLFKNGILIFLVY